MSNDTQASYPWYKRGWGILLIAFGIMIAAATIYIGVRTLIFYRQFRIGGLPPEIEARLTRGAVSSPIEPKENLAYAVDDDPSFGNPNAPLKIIGFADFECSFSQEESLIIRELQARFPDKIYYAHRDFPLMEEHPHAFRAAEAGNCANDQNKFWAMHDKLYQNQERLTDLDIKLYALEIGLDITEFNNCFDGRKYKDEVAIDRADGLAAGVVGTPTFFINGQKVPGAVPMNVWERIIERVK